MIIIIQIDLDMLTLKQTKCIHIISTIHIKHFDSYPKYALYINTCLRNVRGRKISKIRYNPNQYLDLSYHLDHSYAERYIEISSYYDTSHTKGFKQTTRYICFHSGRTRRQ